MSKFYEPSIRPDELYHWKYIRKYRGQNGDWIYEYDYSQNEPKDDNEIQENLRMQDELNKTEQDIRRSVQSHRDIDSIRPSESSSKRVSDIVSSASKAISKGETIIGSLINKTNKSLTNLTQNKKQDHSDNKEDLRKKKWWLR